MRAKDLNHIISYLMTTAGMTFLRSSGLPFLTVAMTMSPHAADGRRLRRAPQPATEMTYRFLAPVFCGGGREDGEGVRGQSKEKKTAPVGRDRRAPAISAALAHRPLARSPSISPTPRRDAPSSPTLTSAQFIRAPTGRPSDMRNLLPAAPPRPRLDWRGKGGEEGEGV